MRVCVWNQLNHFVQYNCKILLTCFTIHTNKIGRTFTYICICCNIGSTTAAIFTWIWNTWITWERERVSVYYSLKVILYACLLTSFTISTSKTKWTVAWVSIETVRTASTSIKTWIRFTNFAYKRWWKHIWTQTINSTHEIRNVDLEILVDKNRRRRHWDEVHMYHHLYKDLVHKHGLINRNFIIQRIVNRSNLRSHRFPK